MKILTIIAVFVIMMTVARAEPRPVPKPSGPGGDERMTCAQVELF
jgi:hypothetical protein